MCRDWKSLATIAAVLTGAAADALLGGLECEAVERGGPAAAAVVGGVQLEAQLQAGRQLRHCERRLAAADVTLQPARGHVVQLGHEMLPQAAVEAGRTGHLQRLGRLVDDGAVVHRLRRTWQATPK